jgi:hypothetical protein
LKRYTTTLLTVLDAKLAIAYFAGYKQFRDYCIIDRHG